MDDRAQSLARILRATGADGRLTPEQVREILAHLEDSVDEKMRGGMPELEAAARALEELGDLGRIAGRFPGAPVETALLTVGEWIERPTPRSHGLVGACFLAAAFGVAALQSGLSEFYRTTQSPPPALVAALDRGGRWIAENDFVILPGVTLLAVGALLAVRTRLGRAALLAPLLGGGVLAAGQVAQFVGPLLGLF